LTVLPVAEMLFIFSNDIPAQSVNCRPENALKKNSAKGASENGRHRRALINRDENTSSSAAGKLGKS
jgi:hypothetical protein